MKNIYKMYHISTCVYWICFPSFVIKLNHFVKKKDIIWFLIKKIIQDFNKFVAYLEEVYPKLKTAKACKTNKDNDTCIAFSIAMSIGKNWQFNPQLLSTSCTDFPQYLHHLACILHTTGKHYHIIKNKQVNHEDSVEMIKK